MDARRAREQCVVVRRAIQPPGCEPDAVSILHQLQPEQRLVHHLAANSDRELGSHQWRSMGCAVWRRDRKNHEARIPAGKSHGAVLWQCRPSSRSFALEHEAANFVSVSQVNQTATEDVDGAKAKAVGTGAAEVNAKRF